jgi:hypothetical protein
MGVETAALERLLARNTQVATEEILAQAMLETQATSAVLFIDRDGEIRLKGGVSVDQDCLDRVHASWATSRAALRGGRTLWGGSWCLWPSQAPRGLVLVYVAGRALRPERVTETLGGLKRLLGLLAGDALDRAESSGHRLAALDAFLQQATHEEVERRQLTMLLHESEWNIARAARRRGVTRATVYKWIRRLGVERLRTRRGLRIEDTEPAKQA